MDQKHGHSLSEDRVDVILREWALARPDLDASPMGIMGRIMRMSRYLDQQLHLVYRLYGLDYGLFDVLATLRRAAAPDGLSPKELNAWCMLTSGAMTARLDRLERAGLVVRRRDPDDRRGILVELSPSGRALIDEVVEKHVAQEERMLTSLDAQERDQLAALLQRLVGAVEASDGKLRKGSQRRGVGRPGENIVT